MTVLEHFKTLCTIPRCSHEADAMLAYLEAKAREYGCDTRTDTAGNLLCSRPGATVTLQAHYDMVCIGRAPEVVPVEENGRMHAEDSTLGADNGMGMAIMLALMEEGAAVDALFTADEEVGLLGARALELPLKTPYLLNLDSEEYGEITVGCAGGVDLNVTLPLRTRMKEAWCYELVADGFPGGHSGVDIDRNIPNAVKELAARLYALEAEVVLFEGGERRNAIARRASALIAFDTPRRIDGAKALGRRECRVIENDVVRMLHGFAHGVREYDAKLGIVRTSVNLAEVATGEGMLNVKLSARSMNDGALRRIESETKAYFEAFGAAVESEGYYAPWEPEENAFVATVREAYESVLGAPVRIGAIHAGLECGILGQKRPGLRMASIGPTIRYPHSTRETVELATVAKVTEVVRRVIGAVRKD